MASKTTKGLPDKVTHAQLQQAIEVVLDAAPDARFDEKAGVLRCPYCGRVCREAFEVGSNCRNVGHYDRQKEILDLVLDYGQFGEMSELTVVSCDGRDCGAVLGLPDIEIEWA